MASIIRAHPRVALASRGDAFATLARSIVGQQISVKAADAVWRRFCTTCTDLTPRSVLRRRATTLRACGLSDRKVEYIATWPHFAMVASIPRVSAGRRTDHRGTHGYP
jgi:DNA-3-methyladenine glycosylase II